MHIQEIGLTRVIAVTYILFAVVILLVATINPVPLSVNYSNDIWFPLFWVISSIGVVRLKDWGRWSSYVFSGVIGVGTIDDLAVNKISTRFRNCIW